MLKPSAIVVAVFLFAENVQKTEFIFSLFCVHIWIAHPSSLFLLFIVNRLYTAEDSTQKTVPKKTYFQAGYKSMNKRTKCTKFQLIKTSRNGIGLSALDGPTNILGEFEVWFKDLSSKKEEIIKLLMYSVKWKFQMLAINTHTICL